MASHHEPSAGLRAGRAAREQSRPSSAWRESWRQWRRTRPFWGGLLLSLAGLELIVIPLSGVLGHGAVKLVIYIGIGGVFGVLIGALMITCGVLICVNPAHRVFYGIAGVLLGILSFPASNLGGFFIGMLLAIAGGGIAFAWTPLTPEPDAPVVVGKPGESWDPDQPTDPGTRGFKNYSYYEEFQPPEELEEPDEPEEPEVPGEPGAPPGLRYLGLAAMPLVLLAGLLGAPGTRAATAAPQQRAGSCILLIICLPSPNPTPTPSPSPSATGSGPGPQPSASPSPSPSSSPSPSPSAPASPTPSPSPSPSPSSSASVPVPAPTTPPAPVTPSTPAPAGGSLPSAAVTPTAAGRPAAQTSAGTGFRVLARIFLRALQHPGRSWWPSHSGPTAGAPAPPMLHPCHQPHHRHPRTG